MNEERARILKMVEDGKITAADALKLLDAVERAPSAPASGKFLRVRVFNDNQEKPAVNVNVPMELITIALQFIPDEQKAKIKEKGFDVESIVKLVETGVTGTFIDVDHEGKHVTVGIE